MAMTVVLGAHAAGVTVSSLALAAAGPRPTLLAECDLSGGSIRTGYRQGQWGGEIGLYHLGVAHRSGQLVEAFEQHLRRLDSEGNRLVLPGLSDPAQAAALSRTWEPLSEILAAMDQHAGYDVVVDAGRAVVQPGSLHRELMPVPVIHRADVVLLVCRNTLASVAQTVPVARAIREELELRGRGADGLRILMVGEGRVQSGEIAHRMHTPVLPVELPWDTAAGQLFTNGPSGVRPPRLARLPLARRARAAWWEIDVVARDRQLGARVPTPEPVMAGVLGRLAATRTEVKVSG